MSRIFNRFGIRNLRLIFSQDININGMVNSKTLEFKASV